MDVVWIVVGVLLLLVTLLDAFLAVLNYDEAGLFVDRIVRAQWVVLRAITRRVGRRWRPMMLRQVTGILIVVTILWWVAGIVFGFAFIYLGAMGMSGLLVTSSGVEPDFLGALYLSLGQFATVGVDNIGPDAAWMNLLTVAEAMISVVMLSFIITFLGGVYGVIQSLQSLSANFFRAGRGISDPIDTLTPFFPGGRPRALDGQLDSILDALTAYGHGLSQNRAAYYFQSGRDQFALPFTLYMTSGVIGALRWGLPTGNESSTEPALLRLTDAFEDFRVRLQRALGWPARPIPVAVTAQAFREAVDAAARGGSAGAMNPWVARFLTIDRRMAELTRSGADIDVDDAYRRYVAWLPFESQAQWLLSNVSRDLDYQPIYRRVATTADGVPLDAPGGGYELLPVDAAVAPQDAAALPLEPSRRGSWLRRRGLFIDPGLVRLSSAGRTIAGVVVAMGVVGATSIATGADPLNGTVLAGLVALFASPAAIGAPAAARRWVGLVAVVPTVLGISLGTLDPRDALATGAGMAIVAATAVWMRRFGARAGGLGQLGFIAYYFALMLALDLSQLPAALLAGGIGLVCSWAASLIPGPSLPRRVDASVAAMYQRVGYVLETAIDLVSSARRDRRLVRTLGRQQYAVQKTAAAIAGYLDESDAAARPSERSRDLRVRVFALRLAVDNLVALADGTAGMTLTIEQRARLGADLVSVKSRIDAALLAGPSSAPAPAPEGADASAEPMVTGPVTAAISELRAAADRLESARVAWRRASEPRAGGSDDMSPEVPATDRSADTAHVEPEPSTSPAPKSSGTSGAASWRQALQAGLSTGLALLLGSLVSTSHQYWAAMPAFSVLSGSDGETRLKALQRILATLLGAALGFGLAILAGHSPVVALPLLVVSVFFIAFLRPISSVWAAFWQTLLFATVYDALGTLSVETLQVRVVETAIGAGVAVAVSALVLPTRTRARMLAAMADVVRRSALITHRSLSAVPRGARTGEDAAHLDDELRDLARGLADLESFAGPLRSNGGSLRRAGVEAQLTALWSIAYDVRRLAMDGTGRGDSGLSAGDARRLDVATADNFAAAQAVLSGALPRRIQAAEDVDPRPVTGAMDHSAILLTVLRLNQALLALIESLKPGTVAMTVQQSGTDAAARDSARAH